MPYAYILYSRNLDRFYVGACHGNLEARIENHNMGRYGGKTFTSKANDWRLFLQFECADYAHAVRLERKIKAMKSRKYTENLLRYGEMRQRILNETGGT